MDVQRLGQAVSRPGIDPRTWVSLAFARADSVVNAKFGVFVDIKLLPTGEEYTAKVPALYAGNGFGLYAKIKKDTQLIVDCPSGDPAHGYVVTGKNWNGTDIPPALAGSNPDDFILVVEKDKNLQIVVQGQGNANIVCDKGTVNLGDAAPQSFIALATNTESRIAALESAWQTASTALAGAAGSFVPTIAIFTPAVNKPVAATKVKAT